jgi:hypothetical protein
MLKLSKFKFSFLCATFLQTLVFTSAQAQVATTPTWTKCASQNGTCRFTGTRQVRYGVSTKWITKTFTSTAGCNNTVFGNPAPNITKSCELSSVIVGAPTPTPTPTPPVVNADTGRRVLKVCATTACTYKLPSQAIAVSANNDIIDVAAGTYNDCFTVSKTNIKLRGVGGRAHLNGKMCNSKGAIIISGSNIVVENFEFSNMYVTDRNGAGIRHQGLGLIVRNSYFHDGENGILSSRGIAAVDPLDTILVENSKFQNLGAGGQAHGVYFGNSSQVTVKNSVFLSSKEQGHEFKSRAMNNTIDCSIFAALDGLDSYSLNFPDAGNVIVKNSIIEQGPYGSNSNVIDYGSESGTKFTVNKFNLSNISVINDYDRGAFFNVRNSTEFKVTNATLVGPGSSYAVQAATESNVVKKASRAIAGLGAYPALPLPTGCIGTIGLSN